MVDHKWIKEALKAFKQVMYKNNIQFWLEYGTLLGAVREGQIISWDKDGDVGIWHKDIQKLKDAEDDFRANGMYIAFQPGHAFLNYMVDKEKKVYLSVLDIYTFAIKYYKDEDWLVRIENNKVYDVRSPAKCYAALSHVKFLNDVFPIPYKAEESLEFAYGKEWKTPINRASISFQLGKPSIESLNKSGRTHHKKLEDL